jgi:hypothetical protein
VIKSLRVHARISVYVNCLITGPRKEALITEYQLRFSACTDTLEAVWRFVWSIYAGNVIEMCRVKFTKEDFAQEGCGVDHLGGSPCHHGMARPRVAVGRDGLQLEVSCEYIE